MQQEPVSFWSEIKKYEDMLSADPDSFCFAPLAELYRKSGMLDEAIRIAKEGVEKHPDYVGGLMALGRACFDKGLKQESREAFEKVVATAPDNFLALKTLGRLYQDSGEYPRAVEMLRKVLVLNPEDYESRDALENLESMSAPPVELPAEHQPETASPLDDLWSLAEETTGPEEELEEVELLDEIVEPSDESIFEEFAFEDESEVAAVQEEILPPSREEKGPLPTITLAEMYISQGYHKRAMTVYWDILKADPDNPDLKRRIYELKMAIDEDVDHARREALSLAMEEGETAAAPAVTEMAEIREEVASALPETPLATLERWMENIRRRKHGV
ncbi:MAG: tetratricopeptide repeat protein [Geobacter sp.]|nr:tetratricopeptide repeat protein [Geobacter sp.]